MQLVHLRRVFQICAYLYNNIQKSRNYGEIYFYKIMKGDYKTEGERQEAELKENNRFLSLT